MDFRLLKSRFAMLAGTWLLLLTCSLASAQDEGSRPIGIYRKILSAGFHRFLHTDIIFYNDALGYDRTLIENKCNWMLVEFFEASLYVDVYELRQTVYKRAYKFLLSNKVNTETAEYKSQKFQMYTYLNKTNTLNCNMTLDEYLDANDIDLGNSSSVEASGMVNLERLVANRSSKVCLISFKIPVHARYHSPSKNGTQYYNVTLNPPKLYYSQCILDNGVTSDPRVSPRAGVIEMPCQIGYESKNEYMVSKINKFVLSSNDTYCLWTNVEYEPLFENPSLKITVPVGDQGHEFIIVILTLVVLTFLALSLAKCLRKKIRTVRCYVNEDHDSQKKKKKKKKKKQSKDQSDEDEDDEKSDDENVFEEDLNAYRESFIQPDQAGDPRATTQKKTKK